MGTVFARGGKPAQDFPDTEAGRFDWAFATLLAMDSRPTPSKLLFLMGQEGHNLSGRLSKRYAERMVEAGYERYQYGDDLTSRWVHQDEPRPAAPWRRG